MARAATCRSGLPASHAFRPQDPVALFEWFNAAEPVLLPLQLVAAMFGMGCTLGVRDFAMVVKDPRGLALGMVLQVVVVPALALLFASLFGLGPGWAIGLLLIGVVPGGAMSNLLTFLGKGSVPLSIALTTAATLLCIGTVPLILTLTAQVHLPPGFRFPTGRVMFDIFAYLLIPVALGMVVRRLHRGRADVAARWSIRAALLLILAIAVGALGSGRIDVVEYGWRPPLLIMAFGLSLSVVTPQLCRLAGRYDDDTVAVGIEVVVRNTGVGLLLVKFFFPGEAAQGHVLYSLLFYAGLAPWLALPMLLRHRYGRSAVLLRRPKPRPAQPSIGEPA